MKCGTAILGGGLSFRKRPLSRVLRFGWDESPDRRPAVESVARVRRTRGPFFHGVSYPPQAGQIHIVQLNIIRIPSAKFNPHNHLTALPKKAPDPHPPGVANDVYANKGLIAIWYQCVC